MKLNNKLLPSIFIIMSLMFLTLGNLLGSSISINGMIFLSLFTIIVYILSNSETLEWLVFSLRIILLVMLTSTFALMFLSMPVLTSTQSKITYPLYLICLFLTIISSIYFIIKDIKHFTTGV